MTENAAIASSSNDLPSRKNNADLLGIARKLGLEELAKSTNAFDIVNSNKLINAKSKVIDRIVNILDTTEVKLKSADINIETGKLINYILPKAGEGLLEKYDFVNQVKLIEIRERLYDIIFKAADDIGNNITKTLATQKSSTDTLLSYIIPKANQRDLEDESRGEIANAQNTIYKAIRSSATEIANNIIAGAAKDAKFKDAIKYVLGDVAQLSQLNDTTNQIKELREFVFLKIKQGLELVAEGDSMRSIVQDLLGISRDTKTLPPEDLPWWARDEDIQELKQKTENKQLETPNKTTLPRTAAESYEEYRDRNDEARKMRDQTAVAQIASQKNNALAEQDTAQQPVAGTASIDANSDSDILQQVNKEPTVVSITDRSIRDLANLQVSELEKIVRPITMLEEKVIESFEKLAKKIDDLEINSGEEDNGTDLMSILEGAALGRSTAGGGGRSPLRTKRLNDLKGLVGKGVARRGLRGLGIIGSALGLAKGAYDYYEADEIEDEEKRTTEKSKVVGKTAGELAGGGLGMWGGAALGTAIAGPVGTVIGGVLGGFFGGWGGSSGGEKLGEKYANKANAEKAAKKEKEKEPTDRDSNATKPVPKSVQVDTKDTKPALATNPPTSTSNLNIDTYNYSYDKEQVTQLRLINDTLIRLAENNNIAVNQYSPEPAEVSAEPSSDNGNVKSNAMLGSNAITDYRSNIRNAYSV